MDKYCTIKTYFMATNIHDIYVFDVMNYKWLSKYGLLENLTLKSYILDVY